MGNYPCCGDSSLRDTQTDVEVQQQQQQKQQPLFFSDVPALDGGVGCANEPQLSGQQPHEVASQVSTTKEQRGVEKSETTVLAADAVPCDTWRQSLPTKDQTALCELQSQLEDSGKQLQDYLVPGETRDSCLLRFLRAKKMNATSAAGFLRADMAWRQEVQPALLADMRPEQILGCEASIVKEYLNTWHQGFDRLGRPLQITHYGKTRLKRILAQTSVEKLLHLHVHNAERAARLCGQQSAKLGHEVSSSLILVDAEGFDPHQLWMKELFAWAKGMSQIDSEHYPLRLGCMMVINAPPVVFYFWKLMQGFLAAETRSQIKILSGRETWLPELLELVDAEELPPEYGGCGVHRGQ